MSGRPYPRSSASPAAWTVTPGRARLDIRIVRAPVAAQVAPEAVWVEAVPQGFSTLPRPPAAEVYQPAFHEIEYLWDFGDPGATFSAPLNVPAPFRDANTATGQIAAHVYGTGGTKRISCIARHVIDPETMEIEEARAEVDLAIGAPGDLWTELNTVVVAPDAEFTGAPPGARATLVTETSDAPWWSTPRHWLTQVNRLVAGGERRVRVLFKRGMVYPIALARPNTRAPHIAEFLSFGAWGDPGLPRPTFARIGQEPPAGWTGGRPVVFDGLAVAQTYDPVTQTGRRDALVHYHEAGYALFTDLAIAQGSAGVLLQPGALAPNAAPGFYTFHDCAFERLATYGLYADERPADRVAYLGCRDIDVGDAPHGDGNRAEGNAQGPLRVDAHGDWVITGSDFFSRHGWSGQGTWPGTDIDATHEQPCLRVFSSGPSAEGGNGRVSVTRCAGEGGSFLSAASLRHQDRPPRGNLVLDQVVHVLSASGTAFTLCETGAVTIRNGLWIKPDVDGAFDIDVAFFFGLFPRAAEIEGNRSALRAEPIRLHNNTVAIGFPTALALGPFGNLDDFDIFEDANNVFYMPRSPGHPRHEDLAPFDTEKLWDLRWRGRLETADAGRLQTRYAAPPGAAALFRPRASSPVIGAVAGLISTYDLLGAPRDITQSRGALEPARAPRPAASQP